MMDPDLLLNEQERIEQTLQALCVADLVDSYCTACSSGARCCAETHSSSDECESSSGGEQEVYLSSKLTYTSSFTDKASYYAIHKAKKPPTMTTELQNPMFWENQNYQKESTGETLFEGQSNQEEFVSDEDDSLIDEEINNSTRRRRHLRIDLSKDEEISDTEILRRLLSPTESFSSDQPLEVILEIVGEEEEDASESSAEKSFQTLREKLQNSSLFSLKEMEDQNSEYGQQCGSATDEAPLLLVDNYRNPSYTNCQNENSSTPSYNRANALLNEIQSCFTETAQLVEKTLDASNNKDNLRNDRQGHLLELEKRDYDVQHALNIFDSIIDHNENQEPSTNSEPQLQNHYDENLQDVAENSDDEGSTFSEDNFQSTILGKQFWNRWQNNFDKDVDELFQECYELSSVEPSDSLVSCLKNLENLCIELRKAKEHILREISNQQIGDKTLALINEDKLALINHLIENKLNSKLKIEKFTIAPPMMGLEGRTHKIIAEVSPPFSILENVQQAPQVLYSNYAPEEEEHDYVNIPNFNDINDSSTEKDSAFETNSDMSTTMTTYDSNSSGLGNLSNNERSLPEGQDNLYQQSLTDSLEDDKNAILSYEDSLALYEDNQELQQSLLSVLHSLNDIHNNFLNRRRLETSLSQESTKEIQNDIKAGIFMNEEAITRRKNRSRSYNSRSRSYTRENRNSTSTIGNMSEDLESIENIRKVSDELKNLWLYHSEDLITPKRQKPSRSLSLTRNYRPKKYLRNWSHPPVDDHIPEDSNGLLKNDMSCSMPNLNLLDENNVGVTDTESKTLPIFLSESINIENTQTSRNNLIDFNNQIKNEDTKSYDVTMNFFKRIMEASQMLNEDGIAEPRVLDPSLVKKLQLLQQQEALKEPYQSNQFTKYNTYMRTC